MKRKMSSKSSLFLLEMMISVLFFAIAAAVCIQVFIKAHQLSRQAENLNMAAGIASGAAEFLASGQEEEMAAYYDKDWMSCSRDEAEYILNVDTKKENGCVSGQIRITDKDGAGIYELATGRYIPWTKDGEVTAGE